MAVGTTQKTTFSQLNQCDGCMRGMDREVWCYGGYIHREVDGIIHMVCQSYRYAVPIDSL